MTQNEVDIIKNAVLDATEAYVDARLGSATFVKTQIGTTVGNPTFRNKRYYHTVKCNQTSSSSARAVTYKNVLSVGNTKFPPNSVVFVVAPNGQFSNQFILGQLDDTPVNIVGGTIRIGGRDPYTDANFYVDSDGDVEIKHGSININNGAFEVESDGTLHATKGLIGNFSINYNNTQSLGDIPGSDNAVGMISKQYLYAYTNTQGENVSQIRIYPTQIWTSGASTRIYLTYGDSWIRITAQQISSNDKGTVAWTGSDERYKTDIKDLNLDFSKKLISNLQPKEYEYKSEKGKRYGFVAQDVRKTLNDMGCENSRLEFELNDEEKMKQLNYNDLIAPLTLCVQDLYKQIDVLKAEKGAK